VATVTPFFKGKGSRTDPSNYRPISVTCFLSKIFERCIKSQLCSYLYGMSYFSDCQHGFLRGRSSETALADIKEFSIGGCIDGGFVVGVFLDIAKAFDCVSHCVLLEILAKAGVDLSALNWFKSFLSDRVIRVADGKTLSTPHNVSIGLAQGSVLGPFLFVVYLNIMLSVSNGLNPDLKVISFADDTTILFRVHGQRVSEDLMVFDRLLSKILDIFDYLKLALNVKKTQVILFHSPRLTVPLTLSHFVVRDTVLRVSHSVTCLGVILDSTFNWQMHTKALRAKLLFPIAIIHRLRRMGSGESVLLMIYRALIESLLSYCITIWGSAPRETLRSLEVCQKSAMRAVLGMGPRESVSRLFPEKGVLLLNKLYVQKMSCFAFRSLHGFLPSSLTSAIPFRLPQRNDRHLNIPLISVCSNWSMKSPLNQVRITWNDLPGELKSELCERKFKRSLKKHLLDQ